MWLGVALVAVSTLLSGVVCHPGGDSFASRFIATRGKKDVSSYYDKRGPSMMGFQGVRGKKDDMDFMESQLADENHEFHKDLTPMDYYWDSEDKRVAPSGFFGVRGKKAPAGSTFFGMRGKKAPSSSGFFGMRGKKAPAAFYGVRGKKNDAEIDSFLESLREAAVREEMEDTLGSRVKRSLNRLTDSSNQSSL